MKSHTNHTYVDAELICESGRPNLMLWRQEVLKRVPVSGVGIIGLNPLIFLKTMLIPLNLEDTPPPLGGVRYGTSKYPIFSAPAAGS